MRMHCSSQTTTTRPKNKQLVMDADSRKKNTVWWFGEPITTEISDAEVEELKNMAIRGFKTIEVFSRTQIVSEDWVIAIEDKKP